ncbi:unnamed protein product [Ambrosiozyma monospora]|uniref:Unnamed protein product n=1 Tax=Ambrosiozyma monospora TaxID=43982 RepID=A0A9W6T1H2_AMBMO|nr:unnamed protein product [Ambrosiozyma monospora]
MRDWIGNEEHLGCVFHKSITDSNTNDGEVDDFFNEEDNETDPNDANNILSEVLIDKASLATNSVKVVSDTPPPTSKTVDSDDSTKYIRVGAFGYPLPDATLAIVNPETKFLSGVLEVGEIWVDSHCISGGFWGLPDDTQAIFQAECSDYEGILNLKFVRTGLLGFTYNGKIFVLGLYEDRISRQVTWYDQYQLNEGKITETIVDITKYRDYRYYYSSHLVKTLARNIPEVVDGSFFNIKINKEYVPVAVLESPTAKSLAMTGDLIAC